MKTNPLTRPHGHQPPSQALIDLMHLRLSWLSYHALELSVQRLLINLGYKEVSILSRTFLRGRTNHGGIDMVAKHRTPVSTQSLAIQLKRSEQPISRSAVLLCRGALDYYDAPPGMLITTGTFAPPASETAAALRGRPIQLIDGAQLARMMIAARIGVRDVIDPVTGSHRLEFMAEFFEALDRYADARRRRISCGIWGYD